jgi:threonine dehydratase
VTAGLHVDEAEVMLQVETWGPDHCDSVVSQLRKAGYTLVFS